MKSDTSLAELSNHIRPEDDLLLWSVRACSQVKRAQHINALVQDGIDWPYLIEASTRHGSLPRLYRSLEAACHDEILVDWERLIEKSPETCKGLRNRERKLDSCFRRNDDLF